jgi:hypothetical protein
MNNCKFIFQITLSITLNNIVKGTLRLYDNQKSDSWFEFWSRFGNQNHNTTIKLCQDDERWQEFSSLLKERKTFFEECLRIGKNPDQGV